MHLFGATWHVSSFHMLPCRLFISPRNTLNSNCPEIRCNSSMQLDFTRRTQQCGPCCHPRSIEIPRLAACTVTVIYRFTLPRFSHMWLSSSWCGGWLCHLNTTERFSSVFICVSTIRTSKVYTISDKKSKQWSYAAELELKVF